MEKVKAIYFIESPNNEEGRDKLKKMTGKSYATGLIIELENGEQYAHLSTDSIVPFEKLEANMKGKPE